MTIGGNARTVKKASATTTDYLGNVRTYEICVDTVIYLILKYSVMGITYQVTELHTTAGAIPGFGALFAFLAVTAAAIILVIWRKKAVLNKI